MDPNNDIKNPIKESITIGQTHGWFATISDWLTKFCFGDIPVSSPIIQNRMLSDALTNLFENTNIAVYVYDSKVVNCFTMIGIAQSNTPLAMRLENSKLKDTKTYISNFERMFNMLQTLGTKGSVIELTYNKITNKFILPIQEVSVYCSNALIDVLDTDDEIIAILLSEVGQNLQICSMFVSDVLYKTSFITGLFGTLLGVSKFILNWAIDGSFWENLDIGVKGLLLKSVCTLGIITLFSYFLANYMTKRRQVYSDKFVALVGYSKPFYSAINKVYDYMFSSSIRTEAVNGLNIMDRILHFINKVILFFSNIFSMLGFNDNLSIYARKKNAQQNILDIENLKNNVNNIINNNENNIIKENTDRFYTIKNRIDIIKNEIKRIK